eukprot:TRINITY_DN2592_c0_g1_i1.p1 TRINITY_DN2592_c0_g1~~TRINITY_DN2592_c0_g1_i1.p1  ORF type:complete len:507 (+),score=119.75 TRINITY_DN2592_c0_g1_i1:27-1547(+)
MADEWVVVEDSTPTSLTVASTGRDHTSDVDDDSLASPLGAEGGRDELVATPPIATEALGAEQPTREPVKTAPTLLTTLDELKFLDEVLNSGSHTPAHDEVAVDAPEYNYNPFAEADPVEPVTEEQTGVPTGVPLLEDGPNTETPAQHNTDNRITTTSTTRTTPIPVTPALSKLIDTPPTFDHLFVRDNTSTTNPFAEYDSDDNNAETFFSPRAQSQPTSAADVHPLQQQHNNNTSRVFNPEPTKIGGAISPLLTTPPVLPPPSLTATPAANGATAESRIIPLQRNNNTVVENPLGYGFNNNSTQQTAVVFEEEERFRIFGEGVVCTVVGRTKMIIIDKSHQTFFYGFLAALICATAGGLLLGVILSHIGPIIAGLLVLLVIPVVIALMGHCKTIIHRTKGKIRRTTNRYLVRDTVQTCYLSQVLRAELQTKIANNNRLSKVVLVLDDDSTLDCTMFFDTHNIEWKEQVVSRVNAFLSARARSEPVVNSRVSGEVSDDSEEDSQLLG